jgi:hypothetical protein
VIKEYEFRAGDKTYTVCYTARARYFFERLAGYPLTELRALTRSQHSDVEIAQLVCAGLEGHRAREKTRKRPWTVDEVLDEILGDLDADDRMRIVLDVCLVAVDKAFETSKKADPAEAATREEGKPPTTA